MVTNEHLPEDGRYMPVSGPPAMASVFSGPSGSIEKPCAARASQTIFAPNPRPPMKRSRNASDSGMLSAVPAERSTCSLVRK